MGRTILNEYFIRDKITSIIPQGWKIVEISKNQIPFDSIKDGKGGFKVTIEGEPVCLRAAGYGDDKGDFRSEEKTIAPRYHIWFMPKAFKERLYQKLKEIIEYENKLQNGAPFKHPYVIVETRRVMIFGIYDKFEHANLAQPKDFTWEMLCRRIKKEFDVD